MNPALSLFLHQTGGQDLDDPGPPGPMFQSNGLALLEAQLANLSINAYRNYDKKLVAFFCTGSFLGESSPTMSLFL